MRTALVRDCMNCDVQVCRPHDSLEEAARLLARSASAALPVVSSRGRVLGLISERQVCRAALEFGRALHAISVWEAMSSEVVLCGPDQSLASVIEIMREHGIGVLPVADDAQRVIGTLGVAELARHATASSVAALDDIGMDDVAHLLCSLDAPAPAGVRPRTESIEQPARAARADVGQVVSTR